MNKIKYILILAVSLLCSGACTDDDGNNPSFGEDEIYLFGDWSPSIARTRGQTLEIKGLIASPNEGLTYQWILDGNVISTEKDLSFKLDESYLETPLKFVVTKPNGATAQREATLLAGNPFVPKTYTKKMVGYYTGTIGEARSIDWQNITHLIVSSVIVNARLDDAGVETGEWFLDDSSLKDLDISTLRGYAHHYGVPILLQFSPRFAKSRHAIPQFDGRHIWGSLTFYNAAVNKKDDLIKAMVAKAKEYGLDGVDILMNKSENTEFANPAALKTFFVDFAKATPTTVTIDGNDYPYLLSQTTHGGWTRAAMTDIYKLPEYSWINMTYFGYVDLSPADPAIVGDTNGAVNAMTAGWSVGLAPDRLVLVVPGYAIRFFGIPPFTWGNLDDQTEYIPYKNVFTRYPAADATGVYYAKSNGGDPTKEMDVIYYEGFTKIENKVNYAITTKNIGGMGVWSIESDSRDTHSLAGKMNTMMGNSFP